MKASNFINWITKLRRIFFTNKPRKLNHRLTLEQNGRTLFVDGEFSKSAYKAKEIWITSRTDRKSHKLEEIKPCSRFGFKIDLAKVLKLHEKTEDVFDFYILVQVPKEKLDEAIFEKNKLESKLILREDNGYDVEYPIRLGRFEHTICKNLDPFEWNGHRCIVYLTEIGNISFSVNHELKPNIKVQVDRVKLRGQRLIFDGRLFTKHSKINSGKALFLGRDIREEVKVPVSFDLLERDTELKYGLHRYTYKASVNLNEAFRASINEDIYDLFFELTLNDQKENTLVRIGNPRFKARYFLKGGYVDDGEKMYAIMPYYTFKRSNLSFQVNEFERDIFVYLRRIMRWSWLLRPFYRQRNIWLVGERSYKAQDTGYQFFKYMREKYPERNVYYVIDKDSAELDNVKPYGNILYYKSKKHVLYSLMATRIIGSHHPDYLYPLRTKDFKKAVKGTKVFLQHGVMGTKNMVANYGKNAQDFDTDLFLVSSDFEKEMIVHDFGYLPQEVKVTGLSRFDSLFANDVRTKRQLLIIPTWRDWIVTGEAFLESEYFERYYELIHHPILHKLSEKYQFDIVFCLHPNMQKFTSYFNDGSVRVIHQGEIDVQHLLKESAMMITDYSSVAFDFSFLQKPIIYYQFDRERFIGKRPSHLDLDNDLPGDIVYEMNEILLKIQEYAEVDFQMKDEFKERASKFLKYPDTQSSERIFQAIADFKPKKRWYEKFAEDELINALFKRFRKSKIYFPSMRVFYSVASRILPIDENLIVFESGVGKQYADSPRYIYEELINRGLDYKKIWICNKEIHFRDRKTKKIKRLSPQYYYYLARAKYWINNQNFPHYIKKRPGTTYIQTWHGTPLKKMLFDIANVQGRSEGYIERVSNAIRNWDYLISPSPYATKAFRSAFRYRGDILEIGYPRNDLFYQNDREKFEKQVRRRLRIPENKKVILYAPTFRDNQTKGDNRFVFDLPFNLDKIKEKLYDDYVLLLRMHVVISNQIKIPEEHQDFVMNVSKYSDMQELLLISDILITDYSSVMFDFANLKRPLLFYTYDLETYRDELRGFYLDFESESPGPFLRSTDEIIHAILNINKVSKDYQSRYEEFYKKYCGLEDGHATQRITELFFSHHEQEKTVVENSKLPM